MDTNYNNDVIEVDIVEVIKIFFRKAWLILSVAALCAIVVFVYCDGHTTPVYQSTGRILIINQREELTSDGQITTNANLTDDYQEVIKSRTVVEEVINNLNLSLTYEQVVGKIGVSIIGETRFLELSITDTDASRAKQILDELQRVSVEHIEEFLEVYAAKIMDEGTVPQSSFKPNVNKYTIVAFLVGAMLVVVGIVIMYIMDGTLKTEEQIKKHLHCVTLGKVSSVKKKPEEYEVIRTNVGASQETLKTLAVTNCNGKMDCYSVAYELAASFAKKGMNVLFVNANLRGEQQKGEQAGLTECLNKKALFKDICKKTNIENLTIIGTGGLSNEPSEILDGLAFLDMLEGAKDSYNKVIICTSALDKYIDAAIVAKQCDGTILVIESGKTHYKVVQDAIKQLIFVKANILGCVIDKR